MPPARVLLYAATVAVFVFAVRALLVEPAPLAVSVCVALAYGALVTTGVLFLRLRMFADALVRGPRGARGVVLTFDDGPHPVYTRAVLDALDRANAKATFFVIGKKAEAHPEVVREILARGHAVGLHSYAHCRLFSLLPTPTIRKDLERGIAALEAITGTRPELFRPPIGHTSPGIVRVADELDLQIVGWTVKALDGIATTPEAVVARVRAGLADGAIVLLHDAPERGEREPACIRALPEVLPLLREKGLAVTPLEEWQ